MTRPRIYAGQHGHTHTITFMTRDENGDDVVEDISSASGLWLVFRRRGQSEIVVVATKVGDGTDGRARYQVTEEDDVDKVAGPWRRWGRAQTEDGFFPSTPEGYTVYPEGSE